MKINSPDFWIVNEEKIVKYIKTVKKGRIKFVIVPLVMRQ